MAAGTKEDPWEELGLAEVTHDPRHNRMRAV